MPEPERPLDTASRSQMSAAERRIQSAVSRILLAEDTTGRRYRSRAVNGHSWRSIFVTLD